MNLRSPQYPRASPNSSKITIHIISESTVGRAVGPRGRKRNVDDTSVFSPWWFSTGTVSPKNIFIIINEQFLPVGLLVEGRLEAGHDEEGLVGRRRRLVLLGRHGQSNVMRHDETKEW